jgi:plastocyanin
MPEENSQGLSTVTLVSAGVTIFAIAALVIFTIGLWGLPGTPTSETLSETIRSGQAARPEAAQKDTINALSATRGFQALVSYTDEGFEPKVSSIQKGETVRFTNNASAPIRLVVNGDNVAEFDIATQQYAEVSFDQKGFYQYNIMSRSAHGGMISVK